ncbi:hypothetical protein ABW20_dc0100986 [Dactylellina cionopaga]|nr:hypothetical protein ABW20_dc0100986 [Dactylellina cionopaga]
MSSRTTGAGDLIAGGSSSAGAPDPNKVPALVTRLQDLLTAIEAHEKYNGAAADRDSTSDPLEKSLLFIHDFTRKTRIIANDIDRATKRAAVFMHYYTARITQMGMSDDLPSRPPPGYKKADAEVDEVIMTETEFDPRLTMATAQGSGMMILFKGEMGDWLKANGLKVMSQIYTEACARCALLTTLCGDKVKLAQAAGIDTQVDLGDDIRRAGAALA